MTPGRAILADERGGMSITMAGVMLLLIALTALFIDTGSMYLTRQHLQGAVDSAALKAAADPANMQEAAIRIITRNIEVDPADIQVQAGRYPPTGHTMASLSALPVAERFEESASDANAVRIRARARAPLYLAGIFGVTDGWVGAGAIALNQPVTQIMASTQFADLSALPAQIPNALLTSLTGTVTTLTSAQYHHLSVTQVGVLDFLDALIAVAGLESGGYEDVLAEPLSPAEILDALSAAIAADPSAAATAGQTLAILAALRGQWSGLGSLTLDALLALDPQSPKSAAGARLDLFNLVLGTALTVNQRGGIVNAADLDLGLASARLRVSVVSPPRYSAIGGPGTRVETAQVRLSLEATSLTPITLTIPLLASVTVDVTLPVYLTQGMGEAEVTAIDCPSSDIDAASVKVRATPGLVSASIGSVPHAALHATVPPPVSPAQLLSVSVLGNPITVTAENHLSVAGSPRSLTFTAPFTAENRQPVPLASPADNLGTRLRLGLTPEISVGGSGALLNTVTSLLTPLLNNTLNILAPLLDQTIMQLQSLFSLDQGYMTVADTYLRCGRPLLVQ